MRTPPLLLAALLLAGCVVERGAPPEEQAPAPLRLEAPWWRVGESWTIEFEEAGRGERTTRLVNFANNTFGDPQHFWLGTADRQEALRHVFFDDNPFLGRIHWEILAPHERGMHSAMYQWPLTDGATWRTGMLFGKEDIVATATAQQDGSFLVRADALKDGSRLEYDYHPSTRWFRHFEIVEAGGGLFLRARVVEHDENAQGTFYFLRGRDYLDADGGSTGEEERFQVPAEGVTSLAFRLDVRASTPAAAIEFIDPTGAVVHRETSVGAAKDKVVEIRERPAAGEWKLRYVGTVTGSILVRGVVEYKATL